jgi:hypothetical protein
MSVENAGAWAGDETEKQRAAIMQTIWRMAENHILSLVAMRGCTSSKGSSLLALRAAPP